jgi:hypothetical protein
MGSFKNFLRVNCNQFPLTLTSPFGVRGILRILSHLVSRIPYPAPWACWVWPPT